MLWFNAANPIELVKKDPALLVSTLRIIAREEAYALYCIVLYCIVLYCIVLYCIVCNKIYYRVQLFVTRHYWGNFVRGLFFLLLRHTPYHNILYYTILSHNLQSPVSMTKLARQLSDQNDGARNILTKLSSTSIISQCYSIVYILYNTILCYPFLSHPTNLYHTILYRTSQCYNLNRFDTALFLSSVTRFISAFNDFYFSDLLIARVSMRACARTAVLMI